MKSAELRVCAAGTTFAQRCRVDSQKVSGSRCVERLLRLGFSVSRRMPGVTVLKRGDRRVAIPDIASLDTNMLRAILRSAQVSDSEFQAPTSRRSTAAE